MANTHRITVGAGLWLRLRNNFNTNATTLSEEVSEVEHFWDREETVISYIHGTEYELLEEGLGHNCNWDHIKIGDIEGYIYNVYTEAIVPTNHLPYECIDTETTLIDLPADDWTKKETEEVYYDRAMKKWCIVMEPFLDARTSSPPSINQRMQDSIFPALKIILGVTNKKSTDEYITQILSKHISAKAEDYYIPNNLIESLRVLVTFPNKYFIKLDTPSAAVIHEEAPQTVILQLSSFDNMISKAVGIMEKYKKHIEVVVGEGSVSIYDATFSLEAEAFDYDISEDIKLLKAASTQISFLLSENGFSFDSIDGIINTYLEIGINNGVCEYIAENSSGEYKKLTIGTSNISKLPPFDSFRTMNYLLRINEIANLIVPEDQFIIADSNTTWSEFLEEYTDFPKLYIEHAPSGTKTKTSNAATAVDIAQQLNNIYSSLGYSGDPCNNGYGIDYWNIWNKQTRSRIAAGIATGGYNIAAGVTGAINTVADSLYNPNTGRLKEEDLSAAWDAYRKGQGPLPIGREGAHPSMREKFYEGESHLYQRAGRLYQRASNFADEVKEDFILNSERAKKEVMEEALSAWESTGDKVIKGIPEVFKHLKEYTSSGSSDEWQIDIMFRDILNKVCVTDLVIPALACFKPPTWCDEIDAATGEVDPEKKETCDALREMWSALPVSFCNNPDSTHSGEACVPTIGLPGDWPTIDIMGQYSKIIWDAIIGMFKRILVDLVKLAIETLLSICRDKEPEDGRLKSIINADIRDLMGDVPLDMEDLLSDIGDLLSPREFCRLLRAEASNKTISTIQSLIRVKHQDLMVQFKSKTYIINYFAKIGKHIDIKMCEDIANMPEELSSPCRNVLDDDPNLRSNLENRADGLTEEQIQDQLDKARQRKMDQVKLLTKIINLLKGPKPFQDVIDELSDSLYCGPNGKGLISLTNPATDYMQDVVFNTIFSNVNMAFNSEAAAYPKLYINQEVFTEEIPFEVNDIILKDPDDVSAGYYQSEEKILNPAVDKMINTHGLRYGPLKEYANTHDGKVLQTKMVKRVSKRIKYLLGEIETNEVFREDLDSEGIYYELTLPPDPELIKALDTLDSIFPGSIDMNRFQLSEWRSRYKIPFVKEGSPLASADDYIIEIYNSSHPDPKISPDTIRIKTEDQHINKNLLDYMKGDLGNLMDFAKTEEGWMRVSRTEYRQALLALDEEIEGVCEDDAPPENFVYPYQNLAFAKYIGNIWQTAYENLGMKTSLSGITISGSSGNIEEIHEYFGTTIYGQLSKDLFSLMGKKISQSQLFEDNEDRTKTVYEDIQTTTSPEIKKIKLAKVPTQLERTCNYDPSILQIESFKTDLRNDIAENVCMAEDIRKTNVNGEATEPNDWETAIIKSIIKLTIRVYLIDYAMRGIFPLTQFKLETDDYVLEYLVKQISADLVNRYSKEYALSFQHYSNIVLTEMVEKREADPSSDITPHEGLKKIIKSVLPDVYKDLKCILMRDLDLDLTNASEDSYKNLLIKEWVPLLDLPEAESDNRFTELSEKTLSNAAGTISNDMLSEYLLAYPKLIDELKIATKDRDDWKEQFDQQLAIGIGKDYEDHQNKYIIAIEKYFPNRKPPRLSGGEIGPINEGWNDFSGFDSEHLPTGYKEQVEIMLAWCQDARTRDGIQQFNEGQSGSGIYHKWPCWYNDSESKRWTVEENHERCGENKNRGLHEERGGTTKEPCSFVYYQHKTDDNLANGKKSYGKEALLRYIARWEEHAYFAFEAAANGHLLGQGHLGESTTPIPPKVQRRWRDCKGSEKTSDCWTSHDITFTNFMIDQEFVDSYGFIGAKKTTSDIGESWYAYNPDNPGMLQGQRDRYPLFTHEPNPFDHGPSDGFGTWLAGTITSSGGKIESCVEDPDCNRRLRHLIFLKNEENQTAYNKYIYVKNNYLEAQRRMEQAQINLDTFNPGDLPIWFNKWSDYIELETNSDGDITKIHQKFDLLSKFNIDNKTFDLTNGNLFLERFWKIRPRNNFGADSINARLITIGVVEAERGSIIRAFNSAFGRKQYNDREGNEQISSEETPGSLSVSDDSIDDHNNYYDTGQYYNLKDFTARFGIFLTQFKTEVAPADTDDAQWKIENYFTEFTPGLRLVYLPPIDTEEHIESGSGSASKFTEIINKLLKNADNSDNSDRLNRLQQLAKIYKLYYIEEQTDRKYINVQANTLTGAVKTNSLTVALYPFPLLDTTSDNYASVGFDECDDEYPYNSLDYSEWYDLNKKATSIFDFDSLNAETVFANNEQEEYNNLIDKLTHDSNTEFKLLFDFVFPLGRYLSMFNVYSMMTSSSISDINEAFTETKDRLWSVYGILTSGGGYQAQRRPPGPSNEENIRLIERWSKGRNEDECCNKFDGKNYSLDGLLSMGDLNLQKPNNPFSGNGLKYVSKLLKETGETIIKQLAEISDPNIMVASGIRKVMKMSGLCKWPHLPPLWMISAGLFPPPFGPGPPITPLGVVYLFLHEDETCINEDVSVSGEPDCSAVGDCTHMGTSPTAVDYDSEGRVKDFFDRDPPQAGTPTVLWQLPAIDDRIFTGELDVETLEDKNNKYDNLLAPPPPVGDNSTDITQHAAGGDTGGEGQLCAHAWPYCEDDLDWWPAGTSVENRPNGDPLKRFSGSPPMACIKQKEESDDDYKCRPQTWTEENCSGGSCVTVDSRPLWKSSGGMTQASQAGQKDKECRPEYANLPLCDKGPGVFGLGEEIEMSCVLWGSTYQCKGADWFWENCMNEEGCTVKTKE